MYLRCVFNGYNTIKAMIKRKKILLVAVICLQFVVAKSLGQIITPDSLRVEAISFSYPQCPDTAFEGQSYTNIAVLVRNLQTDSTFYGSLGILIHSIDSLGSLQVDTLIPMGGTSYTILPNMAVNLFVNGVYNFSSANYRQGSNVVVVWPVVQIGTPTFIDTLTACVNFVKLSDVSEDEIENSYLSVFPNPSTNFIIINTPNKNLIEGVRIFDISGRLVLSPLCDATGYIKVNALVPGIYVLEITASNKQKIRRQFVRQ